jgi:hypothetical protein
MNNRFNGGVIGAANIPTLLSANGVWSPMEQMIAQLQGIWPITGFPGGNQAVADIYALAETMLTAPNMASPDFGGTLSVNSVSLGNYEYVVKQGNQTISAYSNPDWFSSAEDTVSSFCVVNGNLTINSGQTFTPSQRKLFTVLFVNGNLTVNGAISMSARGANHSGTGNSAGATTAGAIRIKTGTYGGITNPQVPAAGSGGVSVAGSTPSAATGGGTAGGGAGGYQNGGTSAAGTSFTGGSGGGGNHTGPQNPVAVSNGGKGGDGSAVNSTTSNGGGAGNPGGTGIYNGAANGGNGTGGVLIVICTGVLSGSGTISANGVAGGTGGTSNSYGNGGGGSGGGSVTVMYTTDSSSITPTASGGAGGTGKTANGGAGGAGTARKLTL